MGTRLLLDVVAVGVYRFAEATMRDNLYCLPLDIYHLYPPQTYLLLHPPRSMNRKDHFDFQTKKRQIHVIIVQILIKRKLS